MDYQDIKEIRERVDVEEIAAQLAEEAAELAIAANKLRRAISGVNPTPVTEAEAKRNIVEELADVTLCAVLLFGVQPYEMTRFWDVQNSKCARWVQRLKEAEAQTNGTAESESSL